MHKQCENFAEELVSILPLSIDGVNAAAGTSQLPDSFFESLQAHFFDCFSRASQDTTHIRLISNGKDYHPSIFYDARIADGLIVHSQIRDRTLASALQSGATLVFDHINDVSPEAQIIQESVEAAVGGDCWIQCYVTQSETSAFNMHGDDHPFAIAQIAGKKQWEHSPEQADRPVSVVYKPGDIAYYPRNFLHNVSGLGLLSMHLTIAFDKNNSWSGPAQLRRRGHGFPYSLGVSSSVETKARLALRTRSWEINNGKIRIATGTSKINISTKYQDLLELLFKTPSTTPQEAILKLDLSADEVLNFWDFGFQQGLLFNPVIGGE
ncbi:MAG: cupin domain-containing protein [Corynebacterium sp.]|nr:cupin domain-containing protein [Corynebacterium sp.]